MVIKGYLVETDVPSEGLANFSEIASMRRGRLNRLVNARIGIATHKFQRGTSYLTRHANEFFYAYVPANRTLPVKRVTSAQFEGL